MDQRTSRLFDVLLVNACGVDYASTEVSPASLAERCHQGPCPLGVFQCPHGRKCGSVTADAWADFFGMDDEWDVCDGGNLKLEAMVKWLCRQLEDRDAGKPFRKEPKTAEQWAVLAEIESQKEAPHASSRHASMNMDTDRGGMRVSASENVLKEQIVHLQKRLREEEAAWKETAKSLAGELRRRRAETAWLAGRLAEMKACRHRENCRIAPGDMRCIECWQAGAEDASALAKRQDCSIEA